MPSSSDGAAVTLLNLQRACTWNVCPRLMLWPLGSTSNCVCGAGEMSVSVVLFASAVPSAMLTGSVSSASQVWRMSYLRSCGEGEVVRGDDAVRTSDHVHDGEHAAVQQRAAAGCRLREHAVLDNCERAAAVGCERGHGAIDVGGRALGR